MTSSEYWGSFSRWADFWKIKGRTWNTFANEGFATGLTMTQQVDKISGYEHPLIERGAIAEFDCTYCPAVKGGACFIVLNGFKGSRLPDFAHIARRMLWVDKHGPLTQDQLDEFNLNALLESAPLPLCRIPEYLDEEKGVMVSPRPCQACADGTHKAPPPKPKLIVRDEWIDGIMSRTTVTPLSDDDLDDLFVQTQGVSVGFDGDIEDLF